MGLCRLAHEYFDDLFHEVLVQVSVVIDSAPVRLAAVDNNHLLAPFTDEEFKATAFQMHQEKSPSPDSLKPGFFRHFCHVCGDDVISHLSCLA